MILAARAATDQFRYDELAGVTFARLIPFLNGNVHGNGTQRPFSLGAEPGQANWLKKLGAEAVVAVRNALHHGRYDMEGQTGHSKKRWCFGLFGGTPRPRGEYRRQLARELFKSATHDDWFDEISDRASAALLAKAGSAVDFASCVFIYCTAVGYCRVTVVELEGDEHAFVVLTLGQVHVVLDAYVTVPVLCYPQETVYWCGDPSIDWSYGKGQLATFRTADPIRPSSKLLESLEPFAQIRSGLHDQLRYLKGRPFNRNRPAKFNTNIWLESERQCGEPVPRDGIFTEILVSGKIRNVTRKEDFLPTEARSYRDREVREPYTDLDQRSPQSRANRLEPLPSFQKQELRIFSHRLHELGRAPGAAELQTRIEELDENQVEPTVVSELLDDLASFFRTQRATRRAVTLTPSSAVPQTTRSRDLTVVVLQSSVPARHGFSEAVANVERSFTRPGSVTLDESNCPRANLDGYHSHLQGRDVIKVYLDQKERGAGSVVRGYFRFRVVTGTLFLKLVAITQEHRGASGRVTVIAGDTRGAITDQECGLGFRP